MLAKPSAPALKRARLQVHTVDPVLNRLLGVLLVEWGYELVAVGEAANLHIVQQGCPGPDGSTCLWLTDADHQAPDRLALPLDMEALWRVTEARLHAMPRRHLRLATCLPAALRAGGDSIAVLVGSLSDHGVRLDARRELARDDEVMLQMDCNGQPLAVGGRVIYCMAKGDLDGAAGYGIGLIFTAPDVHLRQTLRDFIAGSYLQRMRTSLAPAEYAAALPLLRLSAGVLRHLQDPSTPLL